MVDSPSTTVVGTIPDPPDPDAPSVTLPIGFEQSLVDGEPFRYSFASVEEMPQLPTSIPGFETYEGSDTAGLSGLVRSGTLRVFENDGALFPLPEFSVQMNSCNETFWIARWVVRNPDVRIVASNELDPFLSADGWVEDEPWLLPPESPAGMMGGGICSTPGFQFSSTVNGNEANLADVLVEWTYFDRDPFASGRTESSNTTACGGYSYDDSLPISVCSQGTSVSMFQQVLGLPADGFFGPGTESAVRDFQSIAGLDVTGVMDAATWSALGLDEGVPFPDLNGDGSIDYAEYPLD